MDWDLKIEWIKLEEKFTFADGVCEECKIKLLEIVRILDNQNYYAGIMTASKNYNFEVLFKNGCCYIKFRNGSE